MSKKIEGLYTARDLWDSVKELHSGNTAQPFDVGFQPLDDLYKVEHFMSGLAFLIMENLVFYQT